MIELENITKIYEENTSGNKTTAINNISLKIGNKGLVFILGKSGSGKSTLLNILGGLDTQTSGNYIVNGKNTNDFKEKDYDAYRNTCVGFVFQEFNVLEKYNVYENIELAKELQGEKGNREEILKLLEDLGMKDLENRKMNELSGGQKQRVAIARALIKKPQIILADEPTGNLDSMSSAQIFQILKSISKERLVIVVSHDRESARNYADRIIGIKDGQIEYDNGVTYNSESNNLELKKSKLPFKYAFNMAFKNFKSKPSKLFLSILVISIAFMFLAIGMNFSLFNELPLIMRTVKDNNSHTYEILKVESHADENSNFPRFNFQEEDYKNVENLITSKINKIYTLYDNGFMFGFLRLARPDENTNSDINNTFIHGIVDVQDDKIFDNIIGRKPSSPNEIVIPGYAAYEIINYGIILESGEKYFPKDYEDLVSSNKKIKFGDNIITIVGIMSGGSYAYTKGFVDNVILNQDKDNLMNKVFLRAKDAYNNTNDNYEDIKKIEFLENEIDIMTSDGIKKINDLEEGQIVVSPDTLRNLYKDFDNKFMDYYDNTSDYNESLINFSVKYLEDTPLYKNIEFNFGIFSIDGPDDKTIKIVGITLDDNNYIGSIYKDIIKYKDKEVNSLLIYEDNYKNMKKSFSNLTFLNEYEDELQDTNEAIYVYRLEYMNEEVGFVSFLYRFLNLPILIISLIFFTFGFLLFSNFISLSINDSKKEIGVLRGLGASSNDITRIFSMESIAIGIISSIFSIILWLIVNKLLVIYLVEHTELKFNAIVLSPLVIVFIFIFALATSILISSSNTRKISKQKPIDAILEK